MGYNSKYTGAQIEAIFDNSTTYCKTRSTNDYTAVRTIADEILSTHSQGTIILESKDLQDLLYISNLFPKGYEYGKDEALVADYMAVIDVFKGPSGTKYASVRHTI